MMKQLLFLTALLGVVFAPHTVVAAPLRLTYAIFGSGLHAADASLRINESKSGYTAQVDTTTTGFLAKVAPWSSKVISEGPVRNGLYMPTRYDNTTIWRDDAKLVSLKYDTQGRIVRREVREEGHPTDTTPADPKLASGAVDPPSGIIRFFRSRTLKDGCTGQFAVYDGKRRYQVVLANQKATTISPSHYTIYHGPALSCTMEVIPAGGVWSAKNRGWFKIQEDSRRQGGLPRITVASMPNVASWPVPVRMELASPYGNFVMHLTGATQAVK